MNPGILFLCELCLNYPSREIVYVRVWTLRVVTIKLRAAVLEVIALEV